MESIFEIETYFHESNHTLYFNAMIVLSNDSWLSSDPAWRLISLSFEHHQPSMRNLRYTNNVMCWERFRDWWRTIEYIAQRSSSAIQNCNGQLHSLFQYSYIFPKHGSDDTISKWVLSVAFRHALYFLILHAIEYIQIANPCTHCRNWQILFAWSILPTIYEDSFFQQLTFFRSCPVLNIALVWTSLTFHAQSSIHEECHVLAAPSGLQACMYTYSNNCSVYVSFFCKSANTIVLHASHECISQEW